MGSQLSSSSHGERSPGDGTLLSTKRKALGPHGCFPGNLCVHGLSGILCFMPVAVFRDGISQVWGR